VGVPLDRGGFGKKGLEGWGFLAGGEDGQPTIGEGQGGGESLIHLVDGAEGDAIEPGVEEFGAAAVDLGCEAQGTDGFPEEGGFLVLGFGESHR